MITIIQNVHQHFPQNFACRCGKICSTPEMNFQRKDKVIILFTVYVNLMMQRHISSTLLAQRKANFCYKA